MKPGFVVYTSGLAALFLSDVLVSHSLRHADVAEWARFRSLVGISAVIPLIGLDQALVRSPASSALLLRLLSVQVPLLGIAVGAVVSLSGLISPWWLGAGLAIGSAMSLVLFQYFRSHHHQVLSQLALQGWKVAALAMILVLIGTGWRPDLMVWGVGLIVAIDMAMAFAVVALPPERLHPQAPAPARVHYAIGSRFMVTGLMLALSVYAEQLIVNLLGGAADSALYFTSATYFLFPMSFLNGYAAFLIGPWIRDRHDQFLATLRQRWRTIGFGAVGYAIALNLGGWGLWQTVRPSVGAIDPGLRLIFLWVCLARSLSLLPSGYLGIFGMPRQHDILILAQLMAAAAAIILFFILRGMGVDLIHAVAAGSALNWSLRTAVGFLMMGVVARVRARVA